MTPELMQELLSLYNTMTPENFIKFVYSRGSFDGRLDEIRHWSKAIKGSTVIEELLDTGEKIRKSQGISDFALNQHVSGGNWNG